MRRVQANDILVILQRPQMLKLLSRATHHRKSAQKQNGWLAICLFVQPRVLYIIFPTLSYMDEVMGYGTVISLFINKPIVS